MGLSHTSLKIEGQVFECSFTRQEKADDSNFLDLAESYFLLIGTGPVVNGMYSIGSLGLHPQLFIDLTRFLKRIHVYIVCCCSEK